jgi:phosphoribosylformimino-5-aminoimidazole carboxamide ribotide isomerase
MRFDLYPAIDLKEGQVVRLKQGRMADATVYHSDPSQVAYRWIEMGAQWIHVVDLDGAFAGASQNLRAVEKVCRAACGAKVQLGGGLRSLEAIEAALNLGVYRVIIGTSALSGDLVARAVERFGSERIVVGIDAKNGLVATNGWVDVTDVRATDLARRVGEAGVKAIIYTDIAKDGMMAGPNFDEMAAMGRTGLSIIASGGVASLDDIRKLMAIDGVSGAILGKALYTGAVDLGEAIALCR